MNFKIFSTGAQHVGNFIKKGGIADTACEKALKPIAQPIDNAAKTWASKAIPKSSTFLSKLGNYPAKAVAALWNGLRNKNLPFIGTAVVFVGCLVPGLIKAGSELFNGNFKEAGKEALKTSITAFVAAGVGVGLSAAGAGAVAASAGTAAGAWVGNKISNSVIGPKKGTVPNNVIPGNNFPAPGGYNARSVVLNGYPTPEGPITDSGFDNIMRYCDAVARY